MSHHSLKHLASFALIVIVGSPAAHAQITLRTVALAGQQAPDRPAGKLFSSFDAPRIDQQGNVGFQAFADQRGSWAERQGMVRLSVITWQSVPQLGPGVQLSQIGFGVTGVSSLTFWGSYGPPLNYCVWSTRSGTPVPLATEGQSVPGTTKVVGELNGSMQPVATPSGQAAFACPTGGLTNRSGSLSFISGYGLPAPGFPGGTFADNGSNLSMNNQGVVAFSASMLNTGFSRGIWVDDGTNETVRVKSGTPAPGQPGITFENMGAPSINNAGQIAFQNGTPGGLNSIWSEGSGTLAMVSSTGQQAAGVEAGATFSQFNDPSISGSGGIAFGAVLSGANINSSNDGGIWSDSTGSLKLVAREGDHAPGTAEGVVFNPAGTVFMNRLGEVVFPASLTGPGVASDSNGIWYTGPDGVVHRLISSGDLVSIRPGDIRTLLRIEMLSGFPSGGQDGRPSPFNDRGEVTFFARFADGSSGIFVAQIPEPASLLLMCLPLLAGYRTRRRPRTCASVQVTRQRGMGKRIRGRMRAES